MKDPVFARTRYNYNSYSDLWMLVELSGFKTCFTDQMDLEADLVYITSPINGEQRPHIKHQRGILKGPQKAKIIFWNLERPDSHKPEIGIEQSIYDIYTEIFQHVDAIWSSDRWMSGIFRDKRSIFCEMGSHAGLSLTERPHNGFIYDLSHLSYMTYRRESFFGTLKLMGLKMAPKCWGAERDAVLHQSKAMLNVHQTEAPICEPLRIAVAAAYRMPYITEFTRDLYPLEEGVTCLSAPYDKLANETLKWMKGDLAGLGHALHDRLVKNWSFRDGVMDALRKTEQAWL